MSDGLGVQLAIGFTKAVGSFLISKQLESIFEPKAVAQEYTKDVRGLSANAEIDRPQSSYGYPIPIAYGICRVDTNLIWASAYRRKTITQSVVLTQDISVTDVNLNIAQIQSGNQIKYDVEVERDFCDFAVLVSVGEIGGIRRIYFNHVLVLDSDRWGDSRPLFNGQQLGIEFFLGSPHQAQSETIISAEGVNNTPAYRNRAYIVFKDVDITLLGGAIPVVQVECVGISSGYQVNRFTDYLPKETVFSGEVVEDVPGGNASGFTNGAATQRKEFTTVIDSIKDNGLITPLPFASISISQPSFVFAEDILIRAGMDRSLFNVSQLSKPLRGMLVSNAARIREYIEAIVSHCNGVVSETDGKLTFPVNPRLPYLPQYDKNCLISDIGLTVNSLHDVDGRDGYFSSSGGTSEGQFVSIWACCKAYQATGQQYWKDRALFLASALEPYLYGRSVPLTPELFVPHWLFNVKRPFQAETSILNKTLRVTDLGSSLQVTIPESLSPAKIKRIDRAYRKSAAYIWDNREAALINFSYLGIKRNTEIVLQFYDTRTETGWFGIVSNDIIELVKTEYFSYQGYSKRPQLQTSELSIQSITHDSTSWTITVAKPSDYTIEVDDEIIVSYTLVDHGEIINVGDRYEAWPNWRKLAKGEIDAAGDSLYWANDAYRELYAITSDSKWLNALNANTYTIQESHDIDDARQVFKLKPGSNSAYSQDGTFSRSERENFGHNSWYRNADGAVTAFLNGYAGDQEIQIGRGVNDTWRSPTDTFLVRLDIQPNDKSLVIDQNPPPVVIGETYRIELDAYVFIDTDLVFSEQTRYYAKVEVIAPGLQDYVFNLSDFVTKFDSLNPTKQLVSGSPIKAAGISIFNNFLARNYDAGSSLPTAMALAFKFAFGIPTPGGDTRPSFDMYLSIHLMRPMPEIILPYVPYAPMYTVNMLNNELVDWRGVPGSGYTYPHVWYEIGVTAGMTTQLSFLKEAQLQYKNYFSATQSGPFIPALYWDREDARQYGPVNTWGWSWVDPNSQWGGYQYRALQSVAKAAQLSGNADAITITTNYLTWLNSVWTTHTKFPPTDFPKLIKTWVASTQFNAGFYNAVIDISRPTTVNGFVYKPLNTGVSGASQPTWPTTLYSTVVDGGITWECSGYHYDNAYGNYNEPHMASMIMRAAIFARLAGISIAVTDPLITRCYNYLNANFISSGEFTGTWSGNGDWWMFWHAEIIGTLSILLQNSSIITALGLSTVTINNWLSLSNDFINSKTRTE